MLLTAVSASLNQKITMRGNRTAGNFIDRPAVDGLWLTVRAARGVCGDATTHATMERIDPAVSGDSAANWAISTGSGAQASKGSAIIGTRGR